MPAAVTPRAEDVVQGHPRLVEGPRYNRPAVKREEQRFDADEVRRQAQQPRSLRQGFANEADTELLEVAEAAVDQSRRPARRPDGDVLALDERRPQAA